MLGLHLGMSGEQTAICLGCSDAKTEEVRRMSETGSLLWVKDEDGDGKEYLRDCIHPSSERSALGFC